MARSYRWIIGALKSESFCCRVRSSGSLGAGDSPAVLRSGGVYRGPYSRRVLLRVASPQQRELRTLAGEMRFVRSQEGHQCDPGADSGRPVFIFWLYWGAEVRVFLYSGLAEFLGRFGEVIVLTPFLPDALRECFSEVKWRMVPSPRVRLWRARLHSLANRAHGEWVKKYFSDLGVADRAARFDPVAASFSQRISDVIARIACNRPAVHLLNHVTTRSLPVNRRWFTEIVPSTEKRRTVFITSDSLSMPGLIAANSALSVSGWPVVFYPSNWRDVFKGARVGRQFTELVLWNDQQAKVLLRNNPWHRPETLTVIGSSQFDSHFREDWLLPREQFFAHLGLDPNRPLVCYSAVSDSAYKGEAQIVAQFVRELQRSPDGKKVQVVVRLNPSGSDPNYRALAAQFPSTVAVNQPNWWNVTGSGLTGRWKANTPQDARFFTNLIEHCELNVGLPSSVMLDFGVRGRPSVAVAFDSPGAVEADSRASDFLKQGFFLDALHRRAFEMGRTPVDIAAIVRRICISGAAEPDRLREYVEETVGGNDGLVHEQLGGFLVALSMGSPGISQTRANWSAVG